MNIEERIIQRKIRFTTQSEFFFGPPCGGRTRNRQNRNLILYPIELKADIGEERASHAFCKVLLRKR